MDLGKSPGTAGAIALAALTISCAVGCGPAADQFEEITSLPLPWPVPMPSEEQIAEVRACDLGALLDERYPDTVTADDLRESYQVTTPCDWAVLAAAYASRAENDDSVLEEGHLAWANAVSQNAAYAFTDELFFGYLEAPDAVAPPDLAQELVDEVLITYSWGGLGTPVEYEIEITDAATDPHATGTVEGERLSASLEPESVQALGNALTGLLPVARMESIWVCTDNYPHWNVILTYQSEERIILRNADSNAYDFGGPWWALIEGQLYFQSSATFLLALANLVEELDLPVGQPEGMYCSGLESSLLDILYSED